MLRVIAKILLRTIGTLFGLLGIAMLCIGLFLLPGLLRSSSPDWLVLSLVLIPTLFFSVYFVCTFYLVWFRFSPTAVRHACGALGLLAFTQLSRWLHLSVDDPRMPLIFLGSLLGICLACLVASRLLNRLLFAGATP